MFLKQAAAIQEAALVIKIKWARWRKWAGWTTCRQTQSFHFETKADRQTDRPRKKRNFNSLPIDTLQGLDAVIYLWVIANIHAFVFNCSDSIDWFYWSTCCWRSGHSYSTWFIFSGQNITWLETHYKPFWIKPRAFWRSFSLQHSRCNREVEVQRVDSCPLVAELE